MKSFWTSLRPYMAKPGMVVLNMCRVGKDAPGKRLLKEVARLTGAIAYGALRDMTSQIGGVHHNDPTMYRKVYA